MNRPPARSVRAGHRLGRRALLWGLALAGCAPPPLATPTPTAAPPVPPTATIVPDSPPRPATPTPAPDLQRGGRIVEGVLTLPGTLNPLLADNAVERRVGDLLFRGLVTIDGDALTPVPALAERWRVTEAGRRHTFTLAAGPTWHDGSPVTAADAAATLRAVAAERGLSSRATTLATILDLVEAPTPTTVVVRLKQPHAPFLADLATLPILPAAHVEAIGGGLAASPAVGQPIGAGPFALERRQADRLAVRAHAAFRPGPARLDEIELRRLADPGALIAGLGRGELDLAELDLAWLTADHLATLRSAPGVRLLARPSLGLTLLLFHLTSPRQPALTDARVRRALALAVDRPALVARAGLGLGHEPVGTLSPASWAAAPGIEPALPHDPSRAATLLDAAGWRLDEGGRRHREGQPLGLTISLNQGNRGRRALADGLAEAWRPLGVAATIREAPFDAFVAALQGGDFDVALIGLDLGPDPDQSLVWESRAARAGYNFGHYANAQVDRLCITARGTLDRAERLRLLEEIQRLVLTDLPAWPLFCPPVLLAAGPRLGGVAPHPARADHDAPFWWRRPD